MRNLLALVAVIATSCVLFGGDRTECYIDQFGVKRCRIVKDAAPSVASVRLENPTALNVLLSGCGCGNPACTGAGCDCAAGANARAAVATAVAAPTVQTFALDERARSVLFPRVRAFVSTVVENRPRRIANFFARGVLMRFRR